MEYLSETESPRPRLLAAPQTGGPMPGTLRRLLAELAREAGRLSAENAALRKELGEKESGVITVARYFANSPNGPGASLQPPSPQPELPFDPPEPELQLQCGGSAKKEEAALPAARLSADTLSSGEAPHEEASLPQLRAWREQYDRLRGAQELLSAHSLWLVVSRHEHQLYGHNKHPLRAVARAVRHIRQVYGGAQLKSEAEDGGSPWQSAGSSGRAANSNAVVAPSQGQEDLAFDAFEAFVADDDLKGLGEGEAGKTEFLRKALRAEANEYIAEEARKEIARRQKEEVDPRPTGWLALVLEQLPPLVILANAVCLGLQSDVESAVWELLELAFLAFYLLEVLLKAQFLGCRRFLRGSDARWNGFDLACIAFSLTDLIFKALHVFLNSDQNPSLLAVVKFFRLARLARIIKSLRTHYFDDLRTMSLGILSGAKVLAWAVILFFACVFVLGVIMKEMVGHLEDSEEFETVPAAMFSVFRCLTDGCNTYRGTPLHEKMRQRYGAAFMIPYILVFLVVTFGLFNLIVAVFIDRVVSISIKAKQQDLGGREQEMREAIEEMLVSLTWGFSSLRRKTVMSESETTRGKRFHYSKRIRAADEERSRFTAEAMQQLRAEKVQITRELFSTWITDPEVLELLENIEIDTSTKTEIFDVCDVDKSGSLTVDELVNGLMRLRGPISKCDVIAIRLKVRYLTKILEDIHQMLGA